jgi:hypothetical protein
MLETDSDSAEWMASQAAVLEDRATTTSLTERAQRGRQVVQRSGTVIDAESSAADRERGVAP